MNRQEPFSIVFWSKFWKKNSQKAKRPATFWRALLFLGKISGNFEILWEQTSINKLLALSLDIKKWCFDRHAELFLVPSTKDWGKDFHVEPGKHFAGGGRTAKFSSYNKPRNNLDLVAWASDFGEVKVICKNANFPLSISFPFIPTDTYVWVWLCSNLFIVLTPVAHHD